VKTAKKRTALPPSIDQKTSRYPTAENQAQSTRKLVARSSTMRQAKMTITATVMPLLCISTSLACLSCSRPSDRVRIWGLAAARKEKRTARPSAANLGSNASLGHRTRSRPNWPCDLNQWTPARRRDCRP
jgi:hypothetical protein